jgi:hypothetical protein
MPLRDHFHTNSAVLNWDALHGFWPAAIVARLNAILPKEYIAQPRVRLGTMMETELPEPDESEVHVYTQDEFRLVAAIELVSPSNKDRSENRQTFVNKCESLLKKDVCVTIVDAVTSRTANLYGELLDELGAPRTAVSRSVIYAVTCRGRRTGPRWRLESWEHSLAVGAALPTLPIWLGQEVSVPLDLEATYVESCRSWRIP